MASFRLRNGQEIEERLARWAGKFRFLEARTDGLTAEPTDADLDAIDHQGFVRAAVERLRARVMAGGDEAATARRALQILWREHTRLPKGSG